MGHYDATLRVREILLNQKQEELIKQGIRFLQVHVPDINGFLRTKIAPFKLSTGEALNCNLLCTAAGEGAPMHEPLFEVPLSNAQNGYPNIRAIADPATIRSHGWAKEWASVILDSYTTEGEENSIDARHLLRRQELHAQSLGYDPLFAVEYELGIFERDEDLLADGRYRDLKPWGHGVINYSVTRAQNQQTFFAELIDRLASMDIGVSSVTTEYGRGMYEFALTPKTPLEAADDAARARLVLQELCLENGLIATFMARFQPPGRESACGGHHHQSLEGRQECFCHAIRRIERCRQAVPGRTADLSS